jgi:hypothetical protein
MRFVAPSEIKTSIADRDTNKMNRDAINRLPAIEGRNCSGIWVNVSLGNTGIISKLLNCALF